jgi:hypothetical protein
MGRPKKRRRENEVDEVALTPTQIDENVTITNNSSTFAISGMITPPQAQDPYFVTNGIMSELGTTSQPHLGSENFGISPISTKECVLS